jgi:hypothetical protein
VLSHASLTNYDESYGNICYFEMPLSAYKMQPRKSSVLIEGEKHQVVLLPQQKSSKVQVAQKNHTVMTSLAAAPATGQASLTR